ncbi:FAD-dependent oxidoreductase [Halobacteriaceae archaeon SHR40]|uniref:FAD-dependent oxidoreductase n=1 Tax=Halovenus amylolytica TaxID=2500550 RepID=UPI000FE30DDA
MGYTPHVLIVGGGVLGTAIARDFAIRGLEVTLVEQGTLTEGTTGRMHGMLYSGARFAATDKAGARRCQAESQLLREIADHCVRSTATVITEQPDSDDQFGDYMAACEACSIPFQELSGSEIDATELDGSVTQAIRVPEAAVDPFKLTLSNAAGAREFGAEIETGATVEDITFEDGRIAGVTVEYEPTTDSHPAPTTGVEVDPSAGPDGETAADEQPAEETGSEVDTDEDDGSGREGMPGAVQRSFTGVTEDDSAESGESEDIDADFVVNATGAWADRIAAKAGITLPLSRTRGRMLVLDEEPAHTYTQYDPELPLSLSQFWGNAVLGPITGGDDAVEQAIDEMPVENLEDATVLRSYSGVWTQHRSSKDHPYGPGATMIDHEKYDDQWGMLSVIGGTLTTHRLVAKQVVNRVCREFGIDRDCQTDEIPLPDPTPNSGASGGRSMVDTASSAAEAAAGDATHDPVLCETRSVTRSAVEAALESDDVRGTDLTDVRIRTGATMGACQGGRCGHRIASQLYPDHDVETVEESLQYLLASRWQGRRGTLWGTQLAAALDDYDYHAAVLNRRSPPDEEIDLDAFDAGPEPDERERPTMCEAVVHD